MKRSTYSLLLVCVGLCVSSATAEGQTPAVTSREAQYIDPKQGLSIDGLVTMAVTQAPSLAAARARIDAARGDRQQAALRPNPTATFEQREQFGGLETQTMAGMAWPLDLFRRGPRMAVADDALRIAAYWADDEVRRWSAVVRERATEVLAALRQLTIADDRARFAKSRTDLLTARVDAGAARPLDRDLAEVEWRRSQADVIAWQAAADQAMATLKASVGLSSDVPLRLAAPLADVAIGLPPSPQGDGLSARPDVHAMDLEVSRAAAEVKRVTSESRFDLGLYATYMTRRPDLAPDRRMHEAAIGATIGLPMRNRQQGAIASAGAMKRAAESDAAAHHLDAQTEIDAARIREIAAAQTLAVYRGGLMDLAARNLAVVRESFDLGRGTLLDVLEEERRYLELELAYTAALREVVDARTALLRALGVSS